MVGLTTSLAICHQFSSKFIQISSIPTLELQQVAQIILTLQDQTEILAIVILQDQRGSDLLTAERDGLCLFPREECCLYVKQLGIVKKNKIQQLQTGL